MIERKKLSRKDMKSPGNMITHGVFLLFYGFVKYWSFPFSEYFRFLILRLFGRNIRSAAISDGVTVWFPWRLHLGRSSTLNQGVIVDATGGVRIGEGVRIAPYVCINTADHDFSDPEQYIKDQGFVLGEVIIEDDVWIGAGVQINRGVRIGKGSVIGSGSVVTRDIPPNSIAAGVPCKVLRSR